jgi:hypothetical protein
VGFESPYPLQNRKRESTVADIDIDANIQGIKNIVAGGMATGPDKQIVDIGLDLLGEFLKDVKKIAAALEKLAGTP